MVSSGFDRSKRVASEIKKSMAFFIQRELDDPAFEKVTITATKVSKDLSYATVYFTLMGESDKQVGQAMALKLGKASGYLRKLVSKRLSTRVTPQLRFFYDESVQRGSDLETLIDKALNKDAFAESSFDKK